MRINDLTGTHTPELNNVGSELIHILGIIGSGLSVIFIIMLGIKYMMGSIEERAEYKKTLMPYVIGALMVFGASTIAQVFYKMFK